MKIETIKVKMKNGKWTMENGQLEMEMDNEHWTMNNRQSKMENW